MLKVGSHLRNSEMDTQRWAVLLSVTRPEHIKVDDARLNVIAQQLRCGMAAADPIS